jgi:hypothetical protein
MHGSFFFALIISSWRRTLQKGFNRIICISHLFECPAKETSRLVNRGFIYIPGADGPIMFAVLSTKIILAVYLSDTSSVKSEACDANTH